MPRHLQRQVDCPCVCHDGYGGAHTNETCPCKGGPENEWTSGWTKEQIAMLKADPVLHAMSMGDLDALLTDEEKAAMQEHLTNLANQRRRVEAESRGIVMP